MTPRKCGSSAVRRRAGMRRRCKVQLWGALSSTPRWCLMRQTCLITLISLAVVSSASAQSTLRLTVDDAVTMALDHNADLRADRLDPQISDTRVAAAAGAFLPTIGTSLQSNNQLQPPSNFLTPIATRTDVINTNAGVSQRLPWFGTSYN